MWASDDLIMARQVKSISVNCYCGQLERHAVKGQQWSCGMLHERLLSLKWSGGT